AATNPAGALYTVGADKTKICDTCAKTCVESLCPQTTTPEDYWQRDGQRMEKACTLSLRKKMLELTYDCKSAGGGAASVAAKTYEAIKGCPTTDPQPTGGYSMNFKRLKNYTLSDKGALEEAIKEWWSPLEKIGLGTNLEFTDGSPLTSFANMAYEETSKFACSVKNCPNIGKTLVMCQYNPPITGGDNIYEPGKVCSGCRNLGKQCSDPQGLCV
ncbi:hypothetical protein ANCDUO_12317, partial [Ancylostoma duodenale]